MNVYTIFFLLCATSASAWPGREDDETQSGLSIRLSAPASPSWSDVNVFPRDQTGSETLTVEFQIDGQTLTTMIDLVETIAGINTQVSTGTTLSSSKAVSEVLTSPSTFPSSSSTVLPISASTTSRPSVVSVTTMVTDIVSSPTPSPAVNTISPSTVSPSCAASAVTVTVTTTVTKNAAAVGSSSTVAGAYSSSSGLTTHSSALSQNTTLSSKQASTITVTSTTRTTIGSAACQTVQPPGGGSHGWANMTSNWTSWCGSNGTGGGGSSPWNVSSYNSSGGMWNISNFNNSGGIFPWNVSAFNVSVGPFKNYSSGLLFPTMGTLSLVNEAPTYLGARSTWISGAMLLVLLSSL